VNKLGPIHITQRPAVIMGPALIEAGDAPGIIIENVGDVIIKDVIIRGSGRADNQNHGIRIENSGNATLNNVMLDNLEVSGFKEDGILVCSAAKHGFNNIKINNCRSHDNGRSGITVRAGDHAYPATPHSGVSVTHCIAHGNSGIPGLSEHSGSGIFISGFRRGLIQYCEAYENGALCDATQSGPVGILAYNCDECIIEYNLSHDNHSNNHADGGGFDLDGGTTNSMMRHNLSYYNGGYGFELWDFFQGVTAFNRIHNDISWHDCTTDALGAFSVFGRVMASSIYSNIAYIKEGAIGVKLEKWTGSGLTFCDNLYFANGIAQHFVLADTTTPPLVIRDTLMVSTMHPGQFPLA